ncbi:cytochrome P450 [Streptomyces sp. ET3-23]|uniref:cytochrome P450 n=1 Tax=Streptomyces sp. ET3-23 TaxID=2885643 RepID=UPI001D0F8C51|nr:cytochrome P450 [Streptomyces sp. ET3-23]MCC2280739.1 cytochrome P450 [Streptomyces sp. ET3-23]
MGMSGACQGMSQVMFDPLAEGFLVDPYPTYRVLRESSPVFWHEASSSWMVSRYNDVSRVLVDAEHFGADVRRIGQNVPRPALSVQNIDGVQHQLLRQLLLEAQRGWDTAQAEFTAAEMCRTYLTDAPHGQLDGVADLVLPLAIRTTGEFLGVDPVADPPFWEACQAITRSMVPGLEPDAVQPGHDARARLADRLGAWLSDADPRTVVGRFAEGARQTQADKMLVRNSLRTVFLSGVHSAQRFLSTAVLTMLTYSAVATRISDLTADRASMGTAIHELLRHDPPVQAQQKTCVRTTRLAGLRIPAGTCVTVLLGSACRDGQRFPNPDALILDRRPNPHLSLGRGEHACLGRPLLFAQARGILPQIAAQQHRLTLTGTPRWEANPVLRGLATLPLCLN